MSNKFRDELISNNKEFEIIFNDLINNNEIREFSEDLWKFILRDKTSIKINGEPLAFKDLFHLNLNEGRCMDLVFEMVLLLDKFGVYSEAIECVNKFLIGTVGSTYGGHWYVEIFLKEKKICIDTSLVILGNEDSFKKLGHEVINRYDIDTLFKKFPSLIDYYENMIINKDKL